jgi:hypothetical protein
MAEEISCKKIMITSINTMEVKKRDVVAVLKTLLGSFSLLA